VDARWETRIKPLAEHRQRFPLWSGKPVETENEVVDLAHDDAAIADSWKEIQAKYAVEETDVKALASDVKDETPEEKPAKVRDESGKFAKAQTPVTKAEEAPAAATEAPVDSSTPQEATATPQRDLTRPPSSWTPTAKAAYATLPDAIKAEVHKRESDYLNGQSSLIEKARYADRITQAAAPYQPLIASAGTDTEGAFNEFLKQEAILRMGTPQQKAQAAALAIQRYQIPIDELNAAMGGQQTQQPQPTQQQFRDPRVDQWLQQQEQQKQQELLSASDQFLNEKDANGNPVHLYAENVIDDMARLIPAIKAENMGKSQQEILKLAYDKAIWANPEIRSLLLQQQQNDFEAKRQAANLQKVAEAKKAASGNVPRRGSIPAAAPRGSMDDTIRNTARELGFFN
jgi:hypothetical protein